MEILSEDDVRELRAEQLAELDVRATGALDVLSAEEEESVLELLSSQGFSVDAVQFEGANVWLGDTFLNAHDLLEGLGDEGVDKGRVLGQVANGQLAPGVPGAPLIYATQVDARFSFFRPELSSGTDFAHVLAVPDNMPSSIRQVFEDAIEDIGQAGNNDCLDTDFLTIMTQSQLKSTIATSAGVPPRVTTVKYEADPCPHASTKPAPLGCAQFPYRKFVEIAASAPDGFGGVGQTRTLTGGYVAIDSNQIVANNAAARANALSTITHELMHTLGVAHPQEDPFDPVFGTNAVKIDIPGTNGNESGFDSIMARRGTPDRVDTLSADDRKVLRTLYQPLSGRGCGYTNGFSLILPTP